MTGGILPILDGLRRTIDHWVLSTTKLTADAMAGDTTIHVVSSKRFKVGDEIIIRNANEDEDHGIFVDSVPNDTTIVLAEPLRFPWTVAADAAIVRGFHNDFVRAILLGEPDVIDQKLLPAITVNGTGIASEWFTTRTTKERYEIEIGVYVIDGTMEDGYRFLNDVTEIIRQGLKKNLYLLANEYDQSTITADAVYGDQFIKVQDSSQFRAGQMILLETDTNTQEFQIRDITDSTTLCLSNMVSYQFDASNTSLIVPHRFIFNSWPADTKLAKIHKGTLLKASVINYFCEEVENQLQRSWFDQQLR